MPKNQKPNYTIFPQALSGSVDNTFQTPVYFQYWLAYIKYPIFSLSSIASDGAYPYRGEWRH